MFYDLAASSWGQEELDAIQRVIAGGRFTMGENVAAIEKELAAYFGSPQIGCDAAHGLTAPDSCKAATAFGLPVARIETQTNLREEVHKMMAVPGPMVCDVMAIPDKVRGFRRSRCRTGRWCGCRWETCGPS